jgi:hypothetical protein
MSEEIAREMSNMIPESSFAEIPKATHPLHIDNPAEFQRTIFEFLGELGYTYGEARPYGPLFHDYIYYCGKSVAHKLVGMRITLPSLGAAHLS